MVLENLLDPIMSPLLSLPPLLAVAIVSLVVSLITLIITKYTTDQNLMKQLKGEMKELQKEMKELQKAKDMDGLMRVQKEFSNTNLKYMGQSFRSMFFTLIPILLIFGWMNANFAYEPIEPNEQFQIGLTFAKGSFGNISVSVPEGIEITGGAVQEIVNGNAIFTFKGKEGNYIEGEAIKFEYNGGPAFKEVIITSGNEYTKKITTGIGALKTIDLKYRKKIVLPIVNLSWLWSYIIFSIIFSMTLRKWLKVY